jgi:hypothetical protein
MLKLRQLLISEVVLALSFAQISRPQNVEPQPAPKIDPRSQPAVDVLRTIARTIRECPQVSEGETNWGKRPQEIIRVYMGAPTNVIWGVDRSKTPVRSPYTGYMEFSVSRYFWIPPETRDRFDRAGLESAARESGHFGQLWFRYEYDVGPDGAELSKSLVMGSLSGLPALNTWGDNPQGGERLWQDAPKDLCWDRAARNPPAPAPDALPPEWESMDSSQKRMWLFGFTSGLSLRTFPRMANCLAENLDSHSTPVIDRNSKKDGHQPTAPLLAVLTAMAAEGMPCAGLLPLTK